MKHCLEKLNPWYITGLCDSRATFTYSRSGLESLCLYFAIKLTKSDENYLKKIRDFFGVGKIYYGKPASLGKYSGYTKSYAYYRATKLSELEKIIEHLDKYPLQSQKANSYKIWKKMFFLKRENFRNRGKNYYIKLNELAQQLSKINSKNQPWDD